ncbi:hypothetical protein FB382_003190 [Nocardioides ginsengisegetis]|uniref:Uncharacterized protein n=1 Tax=Nocardioides ginsengisegetis TaxID=661491 RepID=A0A7W3PAW5_9ACTN|nr:hypothetical protein [Nocardioides ginsengisegetis]MBA8804899.1 hypothetical protein [Nocardioides ginsengisegetis]
MTADGLDRSSTSEYPVAEVPAARGIAPNPGANDPLVDLWRCELTAQRQFIVSATSLGVLRVSSLATILLDLATERHHDVVELASALIAMGKRLDAASGDGCVYGVATASEAVSLALHNDAEIDRAIVRYADACRRDGDVSGEGLARRIALVHVSRAARVRRLSMRVDRRETLRLLTRIDRKKVSTASRVKAAPHV